MSLRAQLLGCIAAALVSACDRPAPRPLLVAWGGNNQTFPVGQRLGLPLEVYLATRDGHPVPGVRVQWSAPLGSVELSAAGSSTDAEGRARVEATLLGLRGGREVLAEAWGAEGSPVRFSLTAMPGAAAKLELRFGDGQQAPTRGALQPFGVRALDAFDNPVPDARVVWSSRLGGGEIWPKEGLTDVDGLATAQATLGPFPGEHRFAATLEDGTSVELVAQSAPTGLYYVDPTGPGKLRLIRGASSTPQRLVLELIATEPMAGYSLGLEFPLDASRARLASQGLMPGAVLDPGEPPRVALASTISAGPSAGKLVAALSQKSSGAGAKPRDSAIAPGAVLMSLALEPVPGATPGPVLDGSQVAGGLRDKAGTEWVLAKDIAVGTLEVR